MNANLLIYNINEDLTKFHLIAEGVIVCVRVYLSVYAQVFYTLYTYIHAMVHLYLIDSLLDFRNPSNVDNDNELDSDAHTMASTCTMNPRQSEFGETRNQQWFVKGNIQRRICGVERFELTRVYRIISNIGLQNYSFLQPEFLSKR